MTVTADDRDSGGLEGCLFLGLRFDLDARRGRWGRLVS